MRRILMVVLVIVPLCSIFSAARAAKLLVLPNDGFHSLITSINKAQSSIDLVMYGFTNQRLARALMRAHCRGVRIRVLLEHHPYKNEHENTDIIEQLRAHGISLKWSNPKFLLTHQKTMVLDKKTAYVMTFNFTQYQGARNFAIQTNDRAAIDEMERVFVADWSRQNVVTKNQSLIWSPLYSQRKICALIHSAKHTLRIYNQEFGSYAMVKALDDAVARGVQVDLIVPQKRYSLYRAEIDAVARAGVHVKLQQRLYTHAKAMLMDFGYTDARTFVGSMNFSYSGLNKNRELGMVVRDAAVNARLLSIFQYDWGREKSLVLQPVEKLSATTCTPQRCIISVSS